MITRHTYLHMLVALFAVVLLSTPAKANEGACFVQSSKAVDDRAKDGEDVLKQMDLGIVAIAIEQQSVDSSPMVYRQTQRTNVRSADGINISVVRAVGGGISALRYGLSNHRILFGLLARHYYVNGLRRLII
jgi:hypothetical protein